MSSLHSRKPFSISSFLILTLLIPLIAVLLWPLAAFPASSQEKETKAASANANPSASAPRPMKTSLSNAVETKTEAGLLTLPSRFDELIEKFAGEYEINPLFVKALIWQESRFNPRAEGKSGEIGLMQIRMSVVSDWAQATGSKIPSKEETFDPYVNLQIGTWCLNRALSRWDGAGEQQVALALCEYNAGRSKLLRWIAHYDGDYTKTVTLSPSANYVRCITKKYMEYSLEAGTLLLANERRSANEE